MTSNLNSVKTLISSVKDLINKANQDHKWRSKGQVYSKTRIKRENILKLAKLKPLSNPKLANY